MAGLQKAVKAVMNDGEEIRFQFQLDGEECIVGLRGESDTSFRLIVGEDKERGVEIEKVDGSDIVAYSATGEIERRSFWERLRGKEAEVQEMVVQTVDGEVSFRMPWDSMDEVEKMLNDHLRPYADSEVSGVSSKEE